MTRSVTFDFRYGSRDWRSIPVELFRTAQRSTVKYTVLDGQVTKTEERIEAYSDAIVGNKPIADDPFFPPYYFADTTYRKDVAERFQPSHLITTTYEDNGNGTYRRTIDDLDLLTGKTTHSSDIVAGQIPLAPKRNTAFSKLTQTPFLAILSAPCGFVTLRGILNFLYTESAAELAKATKRKYQRDNAVIRTMDVPMNPLLRLGQTLWRKDEARGIDCPELITEVRHKFTPETGDARTQVTSEYWIK